MTLRTVFPHASRVDRPSSPIRRMKSGVSASFTWWNWTFSLVVTWPLFRGAYLADTTPSASICAADSPPNGTFTLTIWASGWRWPYIPCLSLKAWNSVSSHWPDWNSLTCASKSSISSGKISMMLWLRGFQPLSAMLVLSLRAWPYESRVYQRLSEGVNLLRPRVPQLSPFALSLSKGSSPSIQVP